MDHAETFPRSGFNLKFRSLFSFRCRKTWPGCPWIDYLKTVVILTWTPPPVPWFWFVYTSTCVDVWIGAGNALACEFSERAGLYTPLTRFESNDLTSYRDISRFVAWFSMGGRSVTSHKDPSLFLCSLSWRCLFSSVNGRDVNVRQHGFWRAPIENSEMPIGYGRITRQDPGVRVESFAGSLQQQWIRVVSYILHLKLDSEIDLNLHILGTMLKAKIHITVNTL